MSVKISIITVCYNSEKTIGRTIESVKKQNYPELEYIFIDAASTDSTLKIIEESTKDCCFEVKKVSEPDEGIYDAMNKGIKLATGDLICMLNSDDWLTDNALNIVAGNYDNEDHLVIYGMERRIRDGKEVGCFMYGHEFLPERNLAHQTCYITRKAYEKFGLYDTEYRSAGDHELLLRLYMSKEVAFRPVYEVLVNFSEGGMTATYIGHLEDAKIRRKYNVISRKQYTYLVIRAWLLKFIKK